VQGRLFYLTSMRRIAYNFYMDHYKIYKALHIPSGKFYIGRTRQTLESRIGQHWGISKSHRTPFNDFLHTTSMKDWTWEILIDGLSREDSLQAESYYVNLLQAYEDGLNSKPGYGSSLKEERSQGQLDARFKPGNVPWNKGKTGVFGDETIQLMRLVTKVTFSFRNVAFGAILPI